MTFASLVLTAVLGTQPESDVGAIDVSTSQKQERYRSHIDTDMGFMGGGRSFERAGFVGTDGNGTLIDPFGRAPFSGARVAGLAWEARGVIDYARFTVALQKPFTSFSLNDASMIASGGVLVTARSLSLLELRVGLGGEYTLGRVTPFIDMLGSVGFTHADFAVGGAMAKYQATNFSLSVRGGVRVRLGKYLYVAPSGEVGFFGSSTWSVQLMMGVALPMRADE